MATILVVEDDDILCSLLVRWFKHLGYTTFQASDGNVGITLAERELPDLIIMDLGLPGIDGLQATAQLKADPDTRHIPIILLTAYASRIQELTHRDAGHDVVLAKPIDFPNLLHHIDMLIKHAR